MSSDEIISAPNARNPVAGSGVLDEPLPATVSPRMSSPDPSDVMTVETRFCPAKAGLSRKICSVKT